MAEHCWHDKAYGGHQAIQWCHCGLRWREGLTMPLEGHGKYAPKTLPLPKPEGERPGDQGHRLGRYATHKEVTQWLTNL